MERDFNNMLIIMTGLDPTICYFVRVQGLIKKNNVEFRHGTNNLSWNHRELLPYDSIFV
jgi:hypothetical protein